MPPPLVSIIIPVYNRENLIAETLDSVLRQTLHNWECVIIDDGSIDRTLDIAREYSATDNRFKIILRNRDPKGAPTCRNIGIESSIGEYLIFLDSDDILLEDCLCRRIDFMISNLDIDFSVSQGLHGEYPIDFTTQYYYVRNHVDKNLIENFSMLAPSWLTLNSIWRKHSILKNKLFWNEDLTALQDVELHLRAILKGLIFSLNGDIPDCIVRKHGQPRISANLNLERNVFILINYGILPNTHKKNRGLYNCLVARIISEIYMHDNGILSVTSFINKKLLKPLDYYRLIILTGVIKRIKNSKIKGKSYIVNLLLKIFGVEMYFKFKYEDYDQYFPVKYKN
ncbi:glycosyltransferase family 2 protein [Larkinella bovis]|uniref:Glycosyltransferase family 2 protein n=1 Tax=Larkinella bovis TaxID=683041 RepID=A0ABW0II00_9BACT